jgi:mono/diheme cytochrome c family protein
MALCAATLLVGCQERSETPLVEAAVPEGSLTDAEREDFYHLTQGAELFPYGLFLVLEDPAQPGTLLKDNLDRFGFIADPSPQNCLPIGITVSHAADLDMDMVGFNCAVCHVGELTYQGQSMLLDGAPNLGDLFGFRDALVAASEHLAAHPIKLWKLWKQVRNLEGTACEPSMAAAELTPEEEQDVVQRDAAFDDRLDDFDNRDDKFDFLDDVLDEAETLDQTALRLEHLLARLEMTVSYFKWATTVPTTVAGPGRADAWGASRNMMFTPQSMDAPVTVPNLWQFHDIEWLHWIANTNGVMRRNMAEAMAFGAIWDRRSNWTSAVLENLDTLEHISYKFQPPVWPEEILGEIDQSLAARGKLLFDRSCAGCHEAPPQPDGSLVSLKVIPLEQIGTDPKEIENYNRPLLDDGWQGETNYSTALGKALAGIEEQYWEDNDVSEELREQWAGGRPEVTWLPKITGYPARRLHGVWSTPPHLHNGSVPSLEDLLKPSDCTTTPGDCRPAKFVVGTREYDPSALGLLQVPIDTQGAFVFDVSQTGNSNAGHEGPGMGTDLDEADRRALLEFLKTY